MHAVWTIFVFALFIAVLPTNLTFIVIFVFLVLGFLFVASSYFAAADGHAAASINLKKAGGVFCFLAGLGGWYASAFAFAQKRSVDRERHGMLTCIQVLDFPSFDRGVIVGRPTR